MQPGHLTVGFLAVFVSGTAGTLIAVVSGVVRGWADTVLMRLTDAFLALPFLMVAVLVVSVVLSVLRSLVTFGNLVLRRDADLLHLEHGLLRMRERTFDMRRLRGGRGT